MLQLLPRLPSLLFFPLPPNTLPPYTHYPPYTHADPTSEAVVKLWEETWGELVPGTESGVRLYLSELVGVACPALEAQSWPIKAQGAAAIATIAEKMGEALNG